MEKKKGKKGKGKGKGKGKKDITKSGLTKREKEIFLLTIANLQHRIEWRNHLCSIIKEETKKLQEELDIQRRDKIESVNLLEEAIVEQREISEKIERAIPDAENSKVQGEERRARELASKLLQMNEDKMSYDIQLETLKKKVESLESYRLEKADQRIKDIKQQLESDDAEDIFLKATEQNKRREEAFRREMQGILKDEADSFQIELSGKMDANFERITEENRWWADTANSLRIAAERLKAINDVKSSNLRTTQNELKQRKEVVVQASYRQRKQELVIEDIIWKIKELEHARKIDAERQVRLRLLDKISGDLEDIVEEEEESIMKSLARMKKNENEIKILEERLSSEILFGEQLSEFLEKAQHLLMEAVKYSLILTYDGPPKRKKVLEELRSLFAEATQFIYERENRTML